MTRPAWASAVGRDVFGLWAEFLIEETVQSASALDPARPVCDGLAAGGSGSLGG